MATTRVLKTLSIYQQKGKDGVIVNKDPGEEASMSWTAGAPLVVDSSTKELEEWAGGADATQIVGIAQKAATTTTGADVPYYEANPYNIFAGSIINDTSAIALAASHINTNYSLIKSGDNWYIDINDTTSADVKVEIIAPIDPIGDTNARVAFRFIGDMQASVAVT